MSNSFPEALLESLGRFIDARMGLSFPRQKSRDLRKGMEAAAREMGFEDGASFARHLLFHAPTPMQMEVLAAALTVGETYFYREKAALDAAEQELQRLIQARRNAGRRLKIWSAGCASGEEPYTIAMILKNILPDPSDWDLTILATDINTTFLKKAAAGVYTKWSFRDVPPWIIGKYFAKQNDNRFVLAPDIIGMVTFDFLNLMDDSRPALLSHTGGMDMIFCRNVMMYFSPEGITRLLNRLYADLNDGGWLVVSQTELSPQYFTAFEAVAFPGATLYRKSGQAKEIEAITEPVKTDRMYPVAKVPPPRPVFDTGSKVMADAETRGKAPPPSLSPPPATGLDDLRKEAKTLYDQGRHAELEKKLAGILSRDSHDAPARYLMAKLCANQGRLDDAQLHCREAIAAEGMNRRYLYLMAVILKEKGLADEAAAFLKKAIYLDPEFVLAYYTLGNIAMSQGNRSGADKYLASALSLLKKTPADAILPESEGMPAGRLKDMIEGLKKAR